MKRAEVSSVDTVPHCRVSTVRKADRRLRLRRELREVLAKIGRLERELSWLGDRGTRLSSSALSHDGLLGGSR